MKDKRWFKVLRRWLGVGSTFAGVIVLFILVVLWDSVVITIPSGHGGVMWYRFFGGNSVVPATPLREGTHAIFPWDKIFIYNLRLQTQEKKYQVVSQDGLHLNITLSYRWWPFPSHLGLLQRKLGPEYNKTLLSPEIGSYTRLIVSQYTAVEIYSESRHLIQSRIYNEIVDRSHKNGIGSYQDSQEDIGKVIMLKNILLKEVELPKTLRAAIENKLEQAQIVEEYSYRVKRERLESDRKAIEAQGIRRFQETVAPVITNSYLKWLGIEATLKLAESKNSKVVIIGAGESGLPIIFDSVDRQLSDSKQMDSIDNQDSSKHRIPKLHQPTPLYD